jgi:hypothetical protein
MRILTVAAALAALLAASTVSVQAQGRCPQYDGYANWAYKAFCPSLGG